VKFEDIDVNRLGDRLRLRTLHSFWNKVDQRPAGHLGNLFLPHAVGDVGQQIYKDQWKPYAIQSRLPLPPLLPSNLSDALTWYEEAKWRMASESLFELIKAALIEHGKMTRSKIDIAPFVPSAAEYSEARDIINAKLLDCREGVQQWDIAASTLAKGL